MMPLFLHRLQDLFLHLLGKITRDMKRQKVLTRIARMTESLLPRHRSEKELVNFVVWKGGSSQVMLVWKGRLTDFVNLASGREAVGHAIGSTWIMTAPIAFAAFRRGLVLRVWPCGALLVQVKMIENQGYAVLV